MRSGFKGAWVVAAAILVAISALAAGSAFGQGLGEVAQHQRERKAQATSSSSHVYTNEDLARPEILLPEDRARFDTNRQNPVTSKTTQAVSAPVPVGKPAEVPLGDVARHYRLLKLIREQQRLAKENVLPGSSVLASPNYTRTEVIPALPPRRRLEPQRLRDPFAKNQTPVPRENREDVREHWGEEVRARRGDSLWKIASEYLGDGARWRVIFDANPEIRDPNMIGVGQRIRLPQDVSHPLAQQQRVQAGDSLWKIAESHLGSGFAWTCIAQANPQLSNVNLIRPGEILNVPSDCSPRTRAGALVQTYNLPVHQ